MKNTAAPATTSPRALACLERPEVPAARACGCTTLSVGEIDAPAVVRLHPCRTYRMHVRNEREGRPLPGITLSPIRGL